MKILHIIVGLKRAAGTSVFACEIAGEQAAAGHEVAILVKRRWDDEYPVLPSVRILDASQLSALSSQLSPDIVHIHALWDPWLTRMARRFRCAGAKVVWSPHGMLTPWALKYKWWKKLLGMLAYQYWVLRQADLLHATAESEVRDIRRLRLPNPTVVAPLGVSVVSEKGEKRGGQWNLASDRDAVRVARQHYLCFVSRIQRKKGLPNLIRAWASLPADLKCGWRVVIAGPDQDNHLAELRTLCEELGVAGDIDFPGPVYGAEKDALFANAAFSVLPTHSENFGSVVIESLAQGTPVICTKGAPWRELVERRCGWWVDVGVEPLADALRAAMSLSDDERAALGANGRALVAEKYTWPLIARTLAEAYAAAL